MNFSAQFCDPKLRRFNLVGYDARIHGKTKGDVPPDFRRAEAAEDVYHFMVSPLLCVLVSEITMYTPTESAFVTSLPRRWTFDGCMRLIAARRCPPRQGSVLVNGLAAAIGRGMSLCHAYSVA